MDNYGKQIHECKKKWKINKSINNTVRAGVVHGIRKRRKKLLSSTPPTRGGDRKGKASSSITGAHLLPLSRSW
ncbi:hypothetical protein Bca52824_015129 [Brassica carinata]|uniref:Uncharacterized protein n=1 Tax=Brassica carinata TaxID=52824 RepID=A0A8X7W1Z2_BRACI|nr:hypothetical protein Bca52824_015129 [Brassica carinata]